jgi:hypothetical protein
VLTWAARCAVRGFKEGMREGGEKPADVAAPQVTGNTVEGEVKGKTESRA